MKRYGIMYGIIIGLIMILIISCATKVEIEKKPSGETGMDEGAPGEEGAVIAEQEEGMPEEKPAETILEEDEETEEDIIIEIRADSFHPIEKLIKGNTEVKWINQDKKEHKIACYLNGNRVTTSSNMDEGEFFTYTFLKGGEYTCIDAIYGLRSSITVGSEIVSEQPLLSPVGSVVIENSRGFKGSPLTIIALVAITLFLFFVLGRNKKIS